MKRGGYGKGPTHRRAYLIRFTDDENNRLMKLLRRRGGRRITMQAFGHAAVMRAINDSDLGKNTDDDEFKRPSQRSEPPLQGLGIRDRLRESRDEQDEREDRPQREPTPLQQQPIVGVSSRIDDEILALARTVVESPQSTRRDVLKAACRALTRGRSLEESQRLAEDLDAAIQRIDGVPRTALERVRARAGR